MPDDAPDWANEIGCLWREAGRIERQWNAQEARFLDLQIPREFPEAGINDLVHAVYDRFVEDRLAAQVDYQISLARDGGRNPHLHGLISTRRIGPAGFEPTKTGARIWNTIFRDDGGRGMRRHLASALNEVAARRGVILHIDPRPNWERGLPAPEPRLPRSVIRKPKTEYASRKIAEVDRHRALRAEWEAARDEANRADAEVEAIECALAAMRAAMPTIAPPRPSLRGAALVDKCEAVVDLARLFGAPVGAMEVVQENIVYISCEGAGIIVEPDRVHVDGRLNEVVGDLLGELAADLGWDAVTVSATNQDDQELLRRSIRRKRCSLDPRVFQIAAVYHDLNVADVVKTCTAQIDPERSLERLFHNERMSPSTRKVMTALVAGSELEDDSFAGLTDADFFFARWEIGAVAIAEQAKKLKLRKPQQPDVPRV